MSDTAKDAARSLLRALLEDGESPAAHEECLASEDCSLVTIVAVAFDEFAQATIGGPPEPAVSESGAAFKLRQLFDEHLSEYQEEQRARMVESALAVPVKAPFIDLAGIAPDFTNGVDSAKWIKLRWAKNGDDIGPMAKIRTPEIPKVKAPSQKDTWFCNTDCCPGHGKSTW